MLALPCFEKDTYNLPEWSLATAVERT